MGQTFWHRRKDEYMSDSGGVIQGVNSGRFRVEYEKNRMITSDSLADVLLAGQREDGTIGVDMAQAGVDVKTASDDELIFSSKFNMFKIALTDTVTFVSGDFGASGSAYLDFYAAKIIDHGLSKPPVVFAFIETATGQRNQIPYYQFDYGTGALSYQVTASVSNTSLSIEIRSTTALGPSIPVRYYVMQETAGDS